MGKPAYLITNLVTSTNITGANMSGSYPITNAADGVLATTAVWINSGVAEVHMDASPFLSYDSVFIGNHDVVSTGHFDVYGNTLSNRGGSDLFSYVLQYRTKHLFVNLQSLRTAPYVYIAATPAILEMGELIIGPRVLLPRAPMWGIRKEQVNTGITVETLAGIQYDYELSSYKTFEPTFRFPESEYAAFLAFSDAVERDAFVYIPDVDTTEGYYVKKERGFHPTPIGPATDGSVLAHWYDWTLSLRTESEGLTVNP